MFDAVTRAVELGIPTEGKRIREFVTGALDNAGLPVAKASAAISINAGQARLRDIVIRADGADLQAIVNVDLADAMLDALFTLNPPPQAGAAQPAVLIALKGALPAPKRTVDADLLTSMADAARGRAAGETDRSDGAGRARGRGRRGGVYPEAGRTTASGVFGRSGSRAGRSSARRERNFRKRSGAGAAAAGRHSGRAEAARRAPGRTMPRRRGQLRRRRCLYSARSTERRRPHADQVARDRWLGAAGAV